MRGHSSHIVRAYEVINVPVKNNEKQDLGKIVDIMLDKTSGQTAYVVLACGGFLGFGEKLFALPWKDLHYSKDEECFLINIAKETLESKPGFDKDNWPDTSDETIH